MIEKRAKQRNLPQISLKRQRKSMKTTKRVLPQVSLESQRKSTKIHWNKIELSESSKMALTSTSHSERTTFGFVFRIQPKSTKTSQNCKK